MLIINKVTGEGKRERETERTHARTHTHTRNNSTVLWKFKVWHTALSVRWTAEPDKSCKQAKYSKVELVFMEQFQKEEVVHPPILLVRRILSYDKKCVWIPKGDLLCGLTVKINTWKEDLYRIIFWQRKCQIQDGITIISF